MANVKSAQDLFGGGHSDHSDDDGDGYNDYYAGGEKSGQLVRGAPKNEDKKGDRVSDLFNQAKKAGAVQGSAEDLEPHQQGAGGSAFRGAGRTLAGGAGAQAGSAGAAAGAGGGPVTYIITFYRNGIFTVNDGPPRSVEDPKNFPFISSISKGECPEELEPETPGTPITVNLVRKEEDYKEPEKPKYTAFQGSGRTLGSSSAAEGAGGAGTSSAAAASAAVDGEWAGVNEAQPVTSLQLRMADGSRMVARFNHTHTVQDIRRFIRASRPDVTYPYTLMTGVPPQPIADETKSLEAAGLLNAVIIQRK